MLSCVYFLFENQLVGWTENIPVFSTVIIMLFEASAADCFPHSQLRVLKLWKP